MKVNRSKSAFKISPQKKVAIVLSRYNDNLGNQLLENTLKTLISYGMALDNIQVHRVPGALEIPLAVKLLVENHHFDAVITLGVVIKGDTYHFELVCNETYRKLMDLSLEKNIPLVFGVLTVNTVEQAEHRVDIEKLNKGAEFAEAALEMIEFKSLYT